MVKVSVEVRSGAARIKVGVTAQSVRRALSLVGERYPGSNVEVGFTIDPEGHSDLRGPFGPSFFGPGTWPGWAKPFLSTPA